MGCNCNKRQAAQRRVTPAVSGTSGSAEQQFSLLLDGKVAGSFGSRLEADAANARAGYRGIVRQNSGRS